MKTELASLVRIRSFHILWPSLYIIFIGFAITVSMETVQLRPVCTGRHFSRVPPHMRGSVEARMWCF